MSLADGFTSTQDVVETLGASTDTPTVAVSLDVVETVAASTTTPSSEVSQFIIELLQSNELRTSQMVVEYLYTNPNTTTPGQTVPSGGNVIGWFVDTEVGAFWPVSIPVDLQPMSTTNFLFSGSPDQRTVLGCRDGFLRYFDEKKWTDDDQRMDNFLIIGPLRIGGTGINNGILLAMDGILDMDSGPVTWEIMTGTSAQEALNARTIHTGTWEDGGRNYRVHPRTMGYACYIKLSGDGMTQWALEAITLIAKAGGMVRRP